MNFFRCFAIIRIINYCDSLFLHQFGKRCKIFVLLYYEKERPQFFEYFCDLHVIMFVMFDPGASACFNFWFWTFSVR